MKNRLPAKKRASALGHRRRRTCLLRFCLIALTAGIGGAAAAGELNYGIGHGSEAPQGWTSNRHWHWWGRLGHG